MKFCGTEASIQLFFLLGEGKKPKKPTLFVNKHFSQPCSPRVCCSAWASLRRAVLLTHCVPEQGESRRRCQLRKRLSMGMEIHAHCHRLRKLWEGGCCQEENWAAELSWKPSPKVTCFFVVFNTAQRSTKTDTHSEPLCTQAHQWPRGWNIYTDFWQEYGVFCSWKNVLAVLLAICSIQFILAR